MATETIKTAWLNDEQGAKFAPKTLVESIQDAEGTSLNDRLASAGMSAEVEGERLILGTGTGGGTGGGMHKYSTEEKVVGEWIDGKPIYEKTFEFISSTAYETGITTFFEDSTISIISIFNRSMYDIGNKEWFSGLITYKSNLFFGENKVQMELDSIYANRITKVRFTIQYTKTTD